MSRKKRRGGLSVSPVLLACCFLPARLALAAEQPGAEHSLPFNPWTTIWAIASFVLVLAILVKKVFPPIVAALDKRAAEIRKSLEMAEEARAEAAAMMKQHEEDLARARSEGAEIIEEAKRDANKVKDSIVEGARKEAEEITARSRREIEQAKQQALDDLQERAARLGVEIATALIRKELTPEDHRELINERIRSVAG